MILRSILQALYLVQLAKGCKIPILWFCLHFFVADGPFMWIGALPSPNSLNCVLLSRVYEP